MIKYTLPKADIKLFNFGHPLECCVKCECCGCGYICNEQSLHSYPSGFVCQCDLTQRKLIPLIVKNSIFAPIISYFDFSVHVFTLDRHHECDSVAFFS